MEVFHEARTGPFNSGPSHGAYHIQDIHYKKKCPLLVAIN